MLEMSEIRISPKELWSGEMAADHLNQAVESIRNDGYIILRDVVEVGRLAALEGPMAQDLSRILARKDAPFNFNTGNVQQQPPLDRQYLFRDILVNEMVIAVTSAVLGAGMKCNFYSGNTCLPSEERQPVHFDTGEPDGSVVGSAPTFALVVNVPVVDMDARNGSTEIWPGTHRLSHLYQDKTGDIKLPKDVVEKQRATIPPIQPAVRAGSVMIRDMRLWHAGMPNRTRVPRPMLAMVHAAAWWGGNTPLKAPRGTEAAFDHPLLEWLVEFVDGPVDHISHGEPYDFEVSKSGGQ